MKAVKEKVLDEIMDLMDEEDGKRLLKHPKVVAAKVSIARPVMKPKPEEEPMDCDMEDCSDMEMDEDMMGALEGINGIEDLENLDPAKKEKILKMLLK